MSYSQPAPGLGPDATPPRHNPTAATRTVLVLLLVVFVLGYGLAVFLSRDVWNGGPAGTRTVFAATSPDGSPATTAAMSTAVAVIEKRLRDSGTRDARATSDGNDIAITVPGHDVDSVRGLVQSGYLYIRPVLQSIPATPRSNAPSTSATPTPPSADKSIRISQEKDLRQSTNPQLQVISLNFQATRCNGDDGKGDELAGHDDPNLPLITCSTDGKEVFLLDRSILSGAEVKDASSGFDQQRGIYVVSMRFTPSGAKTWADFTEKHLGAQTAFTLDTHVISAPSIREPIPGGTTEISGSFTKDSAHELAGVLGAGALPVSLSFVSAAPATLPATTFAVVARAALIAVGVVLALVVIGTGIYLLRRRGHPGGHVAASQNSW